MASKIIYKANAPIHTRFRIVKVRSAEGGNAICLISSANSA